jgi:hypothetical protein
MSTTEHGHAPGADAPIKKAAGGDETTTATTHLATERIAQQAKRFATLQAEFALKGHALHQSGPGDGPGPVTFLAERWGMVRHLPTLDDAAMFLIQVSGGPGHD